MLSAYPTKHARIGNAVGLDTPASAVALLRRDGRGRLRRRATLPRRRRAGRRRADPRADRRPAARTRTGSPRSSSPATRSGSRPRRYRALVRRRCPPTSRKGVEEHWGPAPGELYVDDDGDIVLAALRGGNVVLMVQPPRGFGENPVAIYHDPDLPPSHHYLAAYRWLAAPRTRAVRRRRDRAPRQARQPGVAARQDAGHVAPRAAPTRRSATCRWSTRSWSTTRARARRPSAARTPRSSTTSSRRWPAPRPTATSPGSSSCSTSTPTSPRWTRPSCRRSAQQIWTLIQAAKLDHDLGLDDRPARRRSSTTSSCTSTAGSARSRTSRSATACTCSAPPRPARPRVDLVLAMLRARQMWGGEQSLPGLREALGPGRGRARRPRDADAVEAQARAPWSQAMEAAGWDAARRSTRSRSRATGDSRGAMRRAASLARSPPTRGRARGWPRTDRRDRPHVLHALDGGFVPAGPVRLAAARPGQRAADRPQLLLRRPEGRPVAAGVGDRARRWPSRCSSATARDTRRVPALGRPVASGAPARCARPATTSPRCWRCSASARSGTRPSRRVTGARARSPSTSWAARASTSPCASPASSATPSRTCWRCSTTPCSWSPALDEPAEQQLRPRPRRRPTHGDERATIRIFGSKPGHLRRRPAAADRLPQLARRRRPRRGLHDLGRLRLRPRPRRRRRPAATMEAAYRRIAVAAKNTDTREHDIADSDDYFQYHGGMVATVRALTGTRARGLRRRLHPPRGRPHPHPARGDRPASSAPAWSTRAGWRRCAGTATRARSSWPRPSTTSSAATPPPASSPTGCTRSSPQSTCSTR